MRIFVIFSAAIVALSSVIAASAGPSRVTYGDVRALFQAEVPAGFIVPGNAAPSRAENGRIFALGGDSLNCVEDWHVAMVTISTSESGAFFSNRKEAVAFFDSMQVTFFVDGNPVNVERTAVKQLNFDDLGDAISDNDWGASYGSFLSPGQLASGSHEISSEFDIPGFGVVSGSHTAEFIVCT